MSKDIRFIPKLPKIGRFNESPAAIIDTVYREKPKGYFGKLFNFFEIRAIYLLIFFNQ